jgi:RNA polymerase sigma factor (sigma-70 family)
VAPRRLGIASIVLLVHGKPGRGVARTRCSRLAPADGTGWRPAVYGLRLTVEGRPTEETELVERAQRGEVVAYEELVRRYQDLAVRTAFLASGGADDAEDAAQEAFVKAYRSLGRFRAGSPFRPWLLRIVANEARNRRRSANRRSGLALRAAEDRRSPDAAPSPEAAVLDRETQAFLLRAVEALPTSDRDVVVARYLLDLPEAETATMLGIPSGTVKSRLSRALARLRQRLDDQRLDDDVASGVGRG